MRIATWNVNSIRARKERVLTWLAAEQPDVMCLQETKVVDAAFPREEFEGLGYALCLSGQRTYNGVAILSRAHPGEVIPRFDDGQEEPDARFLSAQIRGMRIICVYVPNGQAVGSEKFVYKLGWLRRLHGYLSRRCDPTEPLLLCGDLNIAPEPRDVHDPAAWEDTVLFHPKVRAAFQELCLWGLVDTFRLHQRESGLYSWWDYRQLAFQRNHGLRIDHILVTDALAKRCTGARIDREARKGQGASDHAPVIATFSE